MLLSSLDATVLLMYLFLFTNPPRENWLQYVRREYAATIKYPCLITLIMSIKTLMSISISQSILCCRLCHSPVSAWVLVT